jgi:hypothetical protein
MPNGSQPAAVFEEMNSSISKFSVCHQMFKRVLNWCFWCEGFAGKDVGLHKI